jgi:hypothetical protein
MILAGVGYPVLGIASFTLWERARIVPAAFFSLGPLSSYCRKQNGHRCATNDGPFMYPCCSTDFALKFSVFGGCEESLAAVGFGACEYGFSKCPSSHKVQVHFRLRDHRAGHGDGLG